MNTRYFRLILLCGAACAGLSACQHKGVDAQAEKLRRTGTARDMAEARQMAKDNDWPENVQRQEEEAKRARDAAALPKK